MAYQFPSSASPQRVQSGVSAPLKVPLRRGFSLMDWIRLTKSGVDLRGVGPRMLHVTEEELKKHNKPGDCWLAIRGFVYNVTKYVDYHPGGADELMKGAGIDATELFEQVHRWVNYDSMLKACLVGKLDTPFPSVAKKSPALNKRFLVPAAPTSNLLSSPNQPYLSPGLSRNNRNGSNLSVPLPASSQKSTSTCNQLPSITVQVPQNPSYPDRKINIYNGIEIRTSSSDRDLSTKKTQNINQKVNTSFYQGSDFVTLVFDTQYRHLKAKDVVCDLIEDNLFVDIFVAENCISFSLSLSSAVHNHISVAVTEKIGHVEIKLLKVVKNVNWVDIGTFDAKFGTVQKKESFKMRYRGCVLKKRQPVSHDTSIFHFELPPTCHMVVPIGRHVYFKATLEGVEISRPYTVAIPSLIDSDSESKVDSRNFHVMIKIYDGGALTPVIGQMKEGDSIEVGTYDGEFHLSSIDPYKNIVMICAGTGFTPMVRLLHHCLYKTNKAVHLWFCNKTEGDILWRDQLSDLQQKFPGKFSLDLVLSRPDSSWTGERGRVSFHHLEELIEKKNLNIRGDHSALFLICGSVEFSDITKQYLKDLNAKTSDVFAFMR